MGDEVLEVIKWYEQQLKRKLTQAERACIRHQCIIGKSKMPETKDLEKFGIYLDGLEYGKSLKEIPKDRIKNIGQTDSKMIETSSAKVQIFADNEEDRKLLESVYNA